MSTLDQTLVAISIGLFAALVLTICLALAGHNKCYQRGLSYRILEARCRAIVAAVNGAWPEMEEYTGDEYVEEIDAKLRQMRETEKLLSAEYIGNDEFLHHFDPVEVVRYLMARNTELARVAEAVTNWEKAQPSPLLTVAIANRVIEALSMVEAINRVQSYASAPLGYLGNVPKVVSWRMSQFTDIVHSLKEAEMPFENPAQTVLQMLNSNVGMCVVTSGKDSKVKPPFIAAQTNEDYLEAVKTSQESHAALDARCDLLDKQFRATIDVCAKYAPGMTFADSLPTYVESCLEFTRQKAHEAGMAAAFASTKA